MSKTPLWEPWVHGTVVISTQGGLGVGDKKCVELWKSFRQSLI